MAKVLITGGAGFIGANLARRMLLKGHEVRILDNLSRPGSELNLDWLKRNSAGGHLQFFRADLNDWPTLQRAARKVERVFHLAGQVAVTTSIQDPLADFEANAAGTVHLLEAARRFGQDPVVVYASTNKVYGRMDSLRFEEKDGRYCLVDLPFGIPESFPLDFHSPYGCSKGAGDQYARDYQRIYGLRTVVLRQSCIYGPRQFGQSDQGWLAWFVIAALHGQPIEICGDGKQVRDVLYVDDLLDAYELVCQRIGETAGQVFNIGGGPENAIAIWKDFGPLLETMTGKTINVRYRDWRPGDQPVYVSDIRKIGDLTGWRPATPFKDGLRRLYEWVRESEALFKW